MSGTSPIRLDEDRGTSLGEVQENRGKSTVTIMCHCFETELYCHMRILLPLLHRRI